jgi:hypothetical protein
MFFPGLLLALVIACILTVIFAVGFRPRWEGSALMKSATRRTLRRMDLTG